eukprot:scaffold53331_cov68-Phaeocystis_antarctica.AAC.4
MANFTPLLEKSCPRLSETSTHALVYVDGGHDLRVVTVAEAALQAEAEATDCHGRPAAHRPVVRADGGHHEVHVRLERAQEVEPPQLLLVVRADARGEARQPLLGVAVIVVLVTPVILPSIVVVHRRISGVHARAARGVRRQCHVRRAKEVIARRTVKLQRGEIEAAGTDTRPDVVQRKAPRGEQA